jgi:DNA-binding transcriptional ArsR family regulator
VSAPAASRVFAALGDQQRQTLLTLLAREGDASATALARPLAISRQAVDKHLHVLRDAGLVTSVRAGREVRYRLRTEELTRGAGWLTALAEEWDRQLLAVKQLAEAAAEPER